MATVDLDPVFVKALKLLHSKAKDSGTQLKAMLDDAIAQRKGLKVPVQSYDAGKTSSPGKSKSDDDSKRRESEKRSSDKSSRDSSEPDSKKSKLDSKSRSKEEKEAREREKERERAKREKDKKDKEDAQRQKEKAEKERKEKELASNKPEVEVTLVSDEEEPASQIDAGDFAIKMGIACVSCRQFDVSSGNQLVECQECHSLYHQECHKPPLSGEDVSDPRFVWYCSRCMKSLKKMVTQKPITKPKSSIPSTSSGKDLTLSSSKSTKTESSSNSTSQAFRRIDPKVIATPKESPAFISATSKPMVGLEGLAANLIKPRESKSGTSSRKSDPKGDGTKSNNNGYKSDSSSKSSSGKSEEKKPESSKSSSSHKDDKDKDKKSDTVSKSSNKSEDKKESEASPKASSSSAPSSSSSNKEEKKSEHKTEKKTEVGKSSSFVGLSKLKVTPPKSSPPEAGTAVTPTTPDSPASSSSLKSSTSNKQAVANLSMVTANKRIQMMKKKAQTKPGADKKVHVK